MTARFKEELQAELNKFDITRAEALSNKISDAEALGYELTASEDKLWERLTRCIESFRRTMSSLDY